MKEILFITLAILSVSLASSNFTNLTGTYQVLSEQSLFRNQTCFPTNVTIYYQNRSNNYKFEINFNISRTNCRNMSLNSSNTFVSSIFRNTSQEVDFYAFIFNDYSSQILPIWYSRNQTLYLEVQSYNWTYGGWDITNFISLGKHSRPTFPNITGLYSINQYIYPAHHSPNACYPTTLKIEGNNSNSSMIEGGNSSNNTYQFRFQWNFPRTQACYFSGLNGNLSRQLNVQSLSNNGEYFYANYHLRNNSIEIYIEGGNSTLSVYEQIYNYTDSMVGYGMVRINDEDYDYSSQQEQIYYN